MTAALRRSKYEWTKLPEDGLFGTKGQSVAVHRLRLFERIGIGPHPCHWCGRQVRWTPGAVTSGNALVTDHLDGDGQNNAPDNLVPSCHKCNSSRAKRVGDHEVFIERASGVRNRAISIKCQQCSTPFLITLTVVRAKLRTGEAALCSHRCKGLYNVGVRYHGRPKITIAAALPEHLAHPQ